MGTAAHSDGRVEAEAGCLGSTTECERVWCHVWLAVAPVALLVAGEAVQHVPQLLPGRWATRRNMQEGGVGCGVIGPLRMIIAERTG